MKRTSYQSGSVVRKPRAKGPDVWALRYMEDGIQRSKILGTVQKFRTKAAAQKEAAKHLEEINERLAGLTVSALCDRYKQEAMPRRASTSNPYRSYLKRVRAQWGDWQLSDLMKNVMAVENWLNAYETLPTPPRTVKGVIFPGRAARPASKKTKLHMKAFVHRLVELAMKWGVVPMQRNPISLVQVKGKPRRTRQVNLITTQQWSMMIADPELCPHVRTMMYIAMLLGLRASEILGLRWEDVDFRRNILSVRRSCVGGTEDDTKTEGSEQDLPIHDDLAVVLLQWKAENTSDGKDLSVNGWLFGNVITGRPFWRESLQQDHLIPAGRKVGIVNLGWHDFRHTYRAMMRELQIPLEQQRNLMRHEDVRTTLGYGGKTPAEISRPANAKVVEMLRRKA